MSITHSTKGGPRPTSRSGHAFTSGRSTVFVQGQCDRWVVTQVEACLRKLAATGAQHVVVDLSTAIDCTWGLLRLLSRTRSELAGGNGSLTLVGARLPQLATALRLASPSCSWSTTRSAPRSLRSSRRACTPGLLGDLKARTR